MNLKVKFKEGERIEASVNGIELKGLCSISFDIGDEPTATFKVCLESVDFECEGFQYDHHVWSRHFGRPKK